MENNKNISKDKSISFFFPIAFILGIIPLIVRMVVVKVDSNAVDILGEAVKTDLFSQKKAFYLIIFSIILIGISAIFFKKIFRKKDKIVNSILILSGIFLLLTLLSAIFSKYNQASFFGVFDRAEGFITIACYIIIFIYSIYTFKTTNDYKYVVIPIIILVVINSFLGVFQYIGQDLLKSKLGSSIAIPSKYNVDANGLDLLFEKGKLYGTLFHYNYVGSFVAIVLPILFGLTIFEKKIVNKIILGIASLLSVWLLFGSTSRAGIIGISIATIFGIIIFGKIIFKKWKPLLIGFVSIMILAIGVNFATKGIIFERIPSLVIDSFSIFKDTSDFDYKEHVPVKDIKHIDKGVEVVLPNETLKISYENGNFIFKNSNDEIIQYVKDKITYTTNTEPFKNISFNFGKLNNKSITSDGLMLNINGQPTFVFNLKPNKSLHLVNPSSYINTEVAFPESAGFKGKEKLGSARGYIWSRSIPMIKNNLILGTGPDTFIYQFPQNDLIGKYYAYNTPNMLVDKPHNLYLQIALNDGLIALLAFISIMLIYIIDSMKLYALKKEYSKSQILGGITSLGVIGYLFAGIFNDSVISVAPIFWIVLGVGVTLNFMNRKVIK
ncbi:O-antigen ligase family protein [Clostridium uliginosum]|uniref:O-Antigen ligase n=1 Tax=Clostridium uliginosum TaxID=119641 RepID=A0A1I1QVV0_9CLOT|nr:O-antigen ligase family protein [Clostridium uliginosum]SFD26226.1 O-Antigen ligase [Clostridium uliginosum]